MASKTLLRTGGSLMNRLLNPLLQQQKKNTTTSSHFIASSSLQISPLIFPSSLSKFQTSFHLPPNDAQTLKIVSSEGFLYPCGLPSLRFFLPDGDGSHQVSQCFYSPNEHSNLATSGGRGIMGSWLAKRPRVGGESLPEESQKVVQGSQPSNWQIWLWPSQFQ